MLFSSLTAANAKTKTKLHVACEKKLSDKSPKRGPRVLIQQCWDRVCCSTRCCRASCLPVPWMISLYMWTCLSSRPSLSTTKAEGWNFKECPTVRKWPPILCAQDRVSQCLCNDNEAAEPQCPSPGDARGEIIAATRRDFSEPSHYY